MEILEKCPPYQDKDIIKNILLNTDYKIMTYDNLFIDDTRKVEKIKKGDYLVSGKYPIIDQGQDYIGGYTNKEAKIYNNTPFIIFGDHTRNIKYIESPSFIGADGVKVLNIKDTMLKDIDLRYMYYYLIHSDIPDNGYSRHFKFIKNLLYIIPQISIQKKIVEVLDEAQSLINNRKEQIKLLDNLIESVFYDMFGDPVLNDKEWEIEKLEDVCKMRSGGTPTRKEEKYFKGNIPWITTVALDKMHIGTEDAVELITEEAVENSATNKIPVNSLMIGTRVGVGKVAINKVEMCTSQDIVSLLNLEKHFNMQFIYKLLKTFNRYFLTRVRGATIKGINMKVLKEVDLIIPPIKLQNQFAEKVQLIESQKHLLEDSLKLLEDNYNGLMQRAFKGELF